MDKKFDPAHFGLIYLTKATMLVAHHIGTCSIILDVKSGTDLGNTAPVLLDFTPNRADSIGLDVVFDKIVFWHDQRKDRPEVLWT